MTEHDPQTEAPHGTDEELSRERCLLWTCVHEAGHALVGVREGYDVSAVRVHEPGHGETAGISENNVNVAVAGYVAVEAVLGVDAREANKEADTHLEPGSDLMIAIAAAKEAGCVSEDEIWHYIASANTTVAARFIDDTLAAIAEVGLYLAEMSGLRMLTGDALRREITQANASESNALEALRDWWAELNRASS